VSRRRRAVALGALAVALGGLAVRDVADREARLRGRLGPLVPVVVARAELAAGTRVREGLLAVRHVPERFAPVDALADPRELDGLRLAARVAAGGDLPAAALANDADRTAVAPIVPGVRVVDVVAVGSADQLRPGARVDVLVTRDGRDGAPGRTTIAIAGAPLVAVAPAAADAEAPGSPRVVASLRVTLRQAVDLTAAQSFARELRLLARAPGDRGAGEAATAPSSP